MRVALSLALDKQGIVVMTARSVGSALAMCASRPPLDLAVIDLHLPDGRVEELAISLTAVYAPHVPRFIAISRDSLPEPLPISFAAVLKKPFALSSFLQAVYDALPAGPRAGE